MTEIESKIRNQAPYGFSLYKYYNPDEDRSEDVPDILDHLYDVLDETEAKIRTSSYFDAPVRLSEVRERNLDRMNDLTMRLEQTIAKVREERSEYYLCTDSHVESVDLITLPIQTVDAENTKLVLKDTGETVKVYDVNISKFHEVSNEAFEHRFIIAEEPQPDTWIHDKFHELLEDIVLSVNHKYIGFSYLSTRYPELKFYRCKDCDKIFWMSDSNIKWYRNQGLTQPKRCEDCRKLNYFKQHS